MLCLVALVDAPMSRTNGASMPERSFAHRLKKYKSARVRERNAKFPTHFNFVGA
jgi:hypothetical protein